MFNWLTRFLHVAQRADAVMAVSHYLTMEEEVLVFSTLAKNIIPMNIIELALAEELAEGHGQHGSEFLVTSFEAAFLHRVCDFAKWEAHKQLCRDESRPGHTVALLQSLG